MYFLHVKNTFILLHGFRKKTQRISKKDLKIAVNRMNDFLKRKGDLK